MPVNHKDLGLTDSEYGRIIDILKRKPNDVELYMFSLMWSEHCSYKHSKNMLKKLPSISSKVLQGPGQNAGVIDIGDGLAIVFKIESHNHPSAIEPYQGAATGVGGIVRDIFAMGARPVALMNSLRFGELNQPKQRYLFERAVAGIGGYGNCIGVPTVGGEAFFDNSYAGNCLVNAFCLGIVRHDKIIKAVASGSGNLVVLFGAKTGRDGIGGASILASQEFDQTSEEKRPSVQVGDPFVEKLLIEASLEMLDEGLLVALQDLGAAGLTSSASEMASRGDVGITIDVSLVPVREKGMTPWEIMVSESQERMLAVIKPENKEKVIDVCKKWELNVSAIGSITNTGLFEVFNGSGLVAQIPARSLAVDAPTYFPKAAKPVHISSQEQPEIILKNSLKEDILLLLSSPNICSKKWIWQQYDHQIGLNTIILPGADVAVLRIKDTNKALAMTTDGNGRYCHLNPKEGGRQVVIEAARNLACVGAEPLAATDCLNFGNPEKPEIFYQFKETIEGISEACRFLEVPVISGNVSFYNESFGKAIHPTPIIGMVGLIEDLHLVCKPGFNAGHYIYLIGKTLSELGGSEYLSFVHKKTDSVPPQARLEEHQKTARFIIECIRKEAVSSAHDLSDGGLAVALIECCLFGDTGAVVSLTSEHPPAVELFSESQSRYIVNVAPEKGRAFLALAGKNNVHIEKLGLATSEKNIIIENTVSFSLNEAKDIYDNSLQRWVELGSPR